MRNSVSWQFNMSENTSGESNATESGEWKSSMRHGSHRCKCQCKERFFKSLGIVGESPASHYVNKFDFHNGISFVISQRTALTVSICRLSWTKLKKNAKLMKWQRQSNAAGNSGDLFLYVIAQHCNMRIWRHELLHVFCPWRKSNGSSREKFVLKSHPEKSLTFTVIFAARKIKDWENAHSMFWTWLWKRNSVTSHLQRKQN